MTGFPQIPHIDLDRAQPVAFQIRQLRDLNYPQPQIEKNEQPHRHNFQELIWIASGSGLHEIDGKQLAIHPNTLYLIAQGQVHCFLAAEAIHGYVLRFTDDFIPDTVAAPTGRFHQALFNNVQTLSALRIDHNDTQSIERLLELLNDEYHRADAAGSEAILQHLLQVLLIKVEQLLDDSADAPGNPESGSPLLARFLTLLEANYAARHDVEFYAQALATTPRQLSSTVKHHQGKTAKQLIEERLMLEAKRNLRFTDMTVKEIAEQLGFSDPSYFSKVFRRHTSLSPQIFKTR